MPTAAEMRCSGLLLSVRYADGRVTGIEHLLTTLRDQALARDIMTGLDEAGQFLARIKNADKEGPSRVYSCWVDVARKMADRFLLAQGLMAFGLARKRAGDTNGSVRAYTEAVELLGSPFGSGEEEHRAVLKAMILQNLARLWHEQGNKELCVRAAREGLKLVESRSDSQSQATAGHCKKHLEHYGATP